MILDIIVLDTFGLLFKRIGKYYNPIRKITKFLLLDLIFYIIPGAWRAI
jgi:hypothetical protein